MIQNRSVRSLTELAKTGSTSRVLNLHKAQIAADRDARSDIHKAPFFHHRGLAYAIILKHRVRPSEVALFNPRRSNITKVMVPVDHLDLRAGARNLMIGEIGFDLRATELFGSGFVDSPDRRTLELMDELPSLDPFLVSQHLNQHGVFPSKQYFAINEADQARMFDYVREALTPLAVMAGESPNSAGRLVAKVLSSRPDQALSPLQQTFGLSDAQYTHGMFAWRGFLYYKWQLHELRETVKSTLSSIGCIRPVGAKTPDEARYIADAKERILTAVSAIIRNAREVLGDYDRAYRELTEANDVAAFRRFLLTSPRLFHSLGEQLGAVQHIVSFWRYRFRGASVPVADVIELIEILVDFEEGLPE